MAFILAHMEGLYVPPLIQAILVLIIYLVIGAIYRLYWSPLAKFPGPKLAALTLWYEFYYDFIKQGQVTREIARMHEQYGPIVRINPHEIHINDPEYIDEIYSGPSRKAMKYDWAMRMFASKTSAFSTVEHELHRIRRGAIAPFFSKASVQRLEPTIQSVVEKLVVRLEGLSGSGTNVNLVNVYASLTGDVISKYAFGRSYNFLDTPDFAPYWNKSWEQASSIIPLTKQFGFILPLMQNLPKWLGKILNPNITKELAMHDEVRNLVIRTKKEVEEGRKIGESATIFYDILTNSQVRPQEKTTAHLQNEGLTVMAAGTITTAHILGALTFYVIDNPKILQRLQAELKTVMVGEELPTWYQLEQLEYLRAVVNESLRIGHGVVHRLQRRFPDTALQYKEWTIPANTPVSMTSVLIHENPTIFPHPRTFSPERWLGSSNLQLQKYLFAFGRGTRICAGMNLAYCEIYLTAAALFAPGRFRFELFETDVRDVDPPHHYFTPVYRSDSKGIRVLVH